MSKDLYAQVAVRLSCSHVRVDTTPASATPRSFSSLSLLSTYCIVPRDGWLYNPRADGKKKTNKRI